MPIYTHIQLQIIYMSWKIDFHCMYYVSHVTYNIWLWSNNGLYIQLMVFMIIVMTYIQIYDCKPIDTDPEVTTYGIDYALFINHNHAHNQLT